MSFSGLNIMLSYMIRFDVALFDSEPNSNPTKKEDVKATLKTLCVFINFHNPLIQSRVGSRLFLQTAILNFIKSF